MFKSKSLITVFAFVSVLCVCLSSCSYSYAAEVEKEVEIIEELETVESETGEFETGESENTEIDYTRYMLQIIKNQSDSQLLMKEILELQQCILFLMAFIFAWYIINRAFLMIRK